MEKLNKDEFKSLMKYLSYPNLTDRDKRILVFMVSLNHPFTLSYIGEKLEYPKDDIKECFRKVYKSFVVFENEEGDKSKNKFLFNETIVGRDANNLIFAESEEEENIFIDNIKNDLENIDISESSKNGILSLSFIEKLLESKRHFVFALERLKSHSQTWAGKLKRNDSYGYEKLLNIANITLLQYDFSDAQLKYIDNLISTIKHNDYSSECN